MSATMARQGGSVQLELSDMRLALNSDSNGSGFGPLKPFGSIANLSKNPSLSILAGQTRTHTRQPAGFAGSR